MSPEPRLTEVVSERRHLLNLAYRLLGSPADAEDVVQETYVRWYALSRAQQDEIATPAAWLTTVASRICLDQLGSARARRERYVGQWIPEPLPDRPGWVSVGSAASGDPADRITLDESVTMAFLVVLDAMTPAERVVFVLHDVFRYPFAEVAEIVGRSAAACRQLAASARRRLERATAPAAPSAPAPAAPSDTEVVRAFKRAWTAGDIGALLAVLDQDAVATGDGGGVVHAAPEPVVGCEAVARFFAERSGTPGLELVECTVNGQPGLAAQIDGATVSVLAFAITGGRISQVWAVLNPEKLRAWAGWRVSSLPVRDSADTLGTVQELITTPVGDARLTRFPTPARTKRRAVLALGHGAGGGIQAADLQALAAALPASGVEVVLVEQPWVVAGKKIAPAPKTLDEGWVPVAEALRKRARATPFLVGGRSAGARVACRTGLATGAVGIVALSFPLHPPGKPEKSRAEELLDSGLPTLVVQAGADTFGTAAEFPALPPTHRLVGLPAGDHAFKVKKVDPPVLDAVVSAVTEWIAEVTR